MYRYKLYCNIVTHDPNGVLVVDLLYCLFIKGHRQRLKCRNCFHIVAQFVTHYLFGDKRL